MKYILLLLLFLKNIVLFSQNEDSKRDYIWQSGFNDWYPYKLNTFWDFNATPTKVDSMYKKHINLHQVGMICDTKGHLLLFSNGCLIANAQQIPIDNTIMMNAGDIHNAYCPYGYLQAQSMLVLPMPTDTNTFVFFHVHLKVDTYNKADKILTTKLTKNANHLFRVIYIDSTLIEAGDLDRGHLTACRHANGRDWWILYPKVSSNVYHKILFSAKGFEKKIQSIGDTSTAAEVGGGQAVFSPDGTKYVRYNVYSDIRIFDFNRCTGQLSNPIHIPIFDAADTVGFAGCAISSNSRYLYVISTDKIYQLDLQARDIAASKTIILTYDGGVSALGGRYTFAQGLLAPDGKIYVSNTGGRNALHIIEAPDSAGLACRAIQRRYLLLESISYALPYFPNFRLGALRGSPCDTLTTTQELSESYELKLYPNPADGNLSLDLSLPDFAASNTTIDLEDLFGKRVYHASLPPFTPIHRIDVSLFANGVYLVSLKINGKTKIAQKVTILH
jgi:Secretion system C-terminal sorting domain